MRLDKYLTQAGAGSRSQVKEYIRKGLVLVDGIPEKRAERKIDEVTQEIFFQGERIVYEKFVYYMLNKPAGCVTAVSDDLCGTVMDFLKKENRKDLFPVGRLDKDTEGLLLITNDGALAHRLLSPKKHVPKTYLAVLAGDVSQQQADILEKGVDIGEEHLTLPAVFEWKDREKKEAYLTITEGKFHQVKRMFEAVDNKVLFLKRIRMGSLRLDESLLPGEYRILDTEETEELLQGC